MTKKEAAARSFAFIRCRNCIHRLPNDRLRIREPQASSRVYSRSLMTHSFIQLTRATVARETGAGGGGGATEPSFQRKPRDCAVQSTLTPAHWAPMFRSLVNKQFPVNKVEFRLVLAFLSVALATGCLAATLPAPAAAPTIASDAVRSIAEIHMLDATNGWAWSNGLDGQNLLLRTTDGGQTWMDRTPRAYPHVGVAVAFSTRRPPGCPLSTGRPTMAVCSAPLTVASHGRS